MNKECEYFEKCKKISDYREGLNQEDKRKQNYFLTVCSNEGSDICISKQKALDRKLEE